MSYSSPDVPIRLLFVETHLTLYPGWAQALLAARCQHFRAMFTSGMRESHEGEVIIPHLRLRIFKVLLEYVYADR